MTLKSKCTSCEGAAYASHEVFQRNNMMSEIQDKIQLVLGFEKELMEKKSSVYIITESESNPTELRKTNCQEQLKEGSLRREKKCV